MTRIAVLIMTAMMILTASGCGEKEQQITADSYADSLVRKGEASSDKDEKDGNDEQTNAPAEENTKEPEEAEGEEKSEKKDEAKPQKKEEQKQTDVHKKRESAKSDAVIEQAKVNISVSEEEMSRLVDEAEDGYKSFEILPIDSPDFFVGKKLRMAATIQEHEMINIYDSDITSYITDSSFTMSYSLNGEKTEQSFYVYTIAPEVMTTPNGRQYSYFAYGQDKIKGETTEGVIGIMTLIKMRDDIDMGAGDADMYIVLQEVANSSVYNVMKLEN